MAEITTSWTKVKEVYVGNDGYHNVYWRMYAKYSGSSTKTVNVEGRLYLTGSSGNLYCGATTTSGGVVGNYSQWGVNKVGTYYPGETTLWSGSDTTTGSSISAGVRFYSSPWGWTGENLYLSDTLTFAAPYTPPNTPTISSSNVTATSVTITYGTTSFGNPPTGTVTLYGGTSSAPTNAIDTTNTTGDKTFTFTGLTPETTYYFRARANNGQLNSNYSTEISATTPFNQRFYGSVNGQTKKITKLYGPANGVNGISGEIRAGGVGNAIAFDGDIFWEEQRTNLNSTAIDYIELKYTRSSFWNYYSVIVKYSDGTAPQTVFVDNSVMSLMNNTGITVSGGVATVGSDYIDTTLLYGNVTKEITKLYGSVNGVTKRIF